MNEFAARLDYVQRLTKMTLEERIQNDRKQVIEEYIPIKKVLDSRMQKFFQKYAKSSSGNSSFPAVDIGCGRAVGTIDLALTYRPPVFKGDLLFYPSEIVGDEEYSPVESRTRKSLEYHIQENQELQVMFKDQNNMPLFKGSIVELRGLTSAQFNGSQGIIQGPDPKAVGRFAIQLSPDPSNCKSFKKENIQYMGEASAGAANLRMLRINEQSHDFFAGLLGRTREIDILKHETWSNVKEIFGKCALVTCTSLLSCLGYRDPTAWQDTLEFASMLLQVDGYLLQYDEVGHAGFGDSSVMKAFVKEKLLNLELEENEPPSVPRMNIVLWRKN